MPNPILVEYADPLDAYPQTLVDKIRRNRAWRAQWQADFADGFIPIKGSPAAVKTGMINIAWMLFTGYFANYECYTLEEHRLMAPEPPAIKPRNNDFQNAAHGGSGYCDACGRQTRSRQLDLALGWLCVLCGLELDAEANQPIDNPLSTLYQHLATHEALCEISRWWHDRGRAYREAAQDWTWRCARQWRRVEQAITACEPIIKEAELSGLPIEEAARAYAIPLRVMRMRNWYREQPASVTGYEVMAAKA